MGIEQIMQTRRGRVTCIFQQQTFETARQFWGVVPVIFPEAKKALEANPGDLTLKLKLTEAYGADSRL